MTMAITGRSLAVLHQQPCVCVKTYDRADVDDIAKTCTNYPEIDLPL